ncbi:MAG: histidinol-phosphate transaminase [Bernardetiaceae bacterium]|nr:histidinol-phosphate transaminase [Bernardetiaceae bacterium]
MNTTKNIFDYLRPHIAALKPYSSARDEFSGSEGIFLDANENPYQNSEKALNRYPDPLQKQLKAQIAILKACKAEQIFLGNGSDEAIDLLIRAFCEPQKDSILITPPTYGMYRVSADIHQIHIAHAPLAPETFEIEPEDLLIKAKASKAKIVFLCSPNNPTGNCPLTLQQIAYIAQKLDALLVIDEAYADFALMPSAIKLLEEHENLLVLQTFSKAWGLAALRLGMAFANPKLIAILNKIKPPYNINALTQQYAQKALAAIENKDKQVSEIKQRRAYLAEALRQKSNVVKVFDSEANFLLVRVDDADAVYQKMLAHKIILRNRSRELHCENCLRITIGTEQEVEMLLRCW